jgi:hypothetical protein
MAFNVMEAMANPNANHVLNCILELQCIPAEHKPSRLLTLELLVDGIIDELLVDVRKPAEHKYGIRVLQRCIRFGKPGSAKVCELVKALLDHAADLCTHEYGHYVMEEIMKASSVDERGRPINQSVGSEQKVRLAQFLLANLSALAKDQNFPAVNRMIKEALTKGNAEQRNDILKAFTANACLLTVMSSDHFGYGAAKFFLQQVATPQVKLEVLNQLLATSSESASDLSQGSHGLDIHPCSTNWRLRFTQTDSSSAWCESEPKSEAGRPKVKRSRNDPGEYRRKLLGVLELVRQELEVAPDEVTGSS